MSGATWARIGAIFGAIAVVAGTFGAHGLKGNVPPERLETFEIGVRYQMYHALALLAVGLLAIRSGPRPGKALNAAGWLLLVGSVVFPGSLYALVLTGDSARWLGMVAPIGGVALIAGWVALAVGCSPVGMGGVARRSEVEASEYVS